MAKPFPSEPPIAVDSFSSLLRRQYQEACDFFVGNISIKPTELRCCTAARLSYKLLDEYGHKKKLDASPSSSQPSTEHTRKRPIAAITDEPPSSTNESPVTTPSHAISAASVAHASVSTVIDEMMGVDKSIKYSKRDIINDKQMISSNLSIIQQPALSASIHNEANRFTSSTELSSLTLAARPTPPKPMWHPPWKLHRVISGHQGWVQCVAVDPSNEWFATGGNDRLLKIWDLASGSLKLSLTGHINTVKDIAISARHPYLFSCGEDHKVKCWDLEQNKIVRDYHGHLSGVYCLALHPTLDILASGGRDAAVRLWDMRTKNAIHVFGGHSGTIMSLQSQGAEPQLISGSQDKTIRLWDIAAGKCNAVLTNHKKSIRAMAVHPKEYTFCSAGADNIKVWRCPDGKFDRNIEGHNAIANCCAIKEEGDSSILVVGTNNGQLNFWDWRSGYKYDTIQSKVQPGSLESESGIFACAFDKSETRLITGECDKTIKIWKEDTEATEETTPIHWKAPRSIKNY